MATINYYLKGALSEKQIKELEKKGENKFLDELMSKPLPILLMVSTMGYRLQVYINKRIEQKNWDKSKQLYNAKKYRLNVAERNKWLNELKFDVTKLVDLNEINAKLTTKEELLELLSNRNPIKPSKVSLVSLLDQFIEVHKTKDGFPLRPNSLKGYNSLKYHLNNYSKELNRSITPEDITLRFLNTFKEYLSREIVLNEEKTITLGDITVVKIIKRFKTFIKYLFPKEIVKRFDLSEIRSVEKEGSVVVMKPEEVLIMQNAELKGLLKNQVRDIFCFQCWTGQRFDDVMHIEHNDIIKEDEDWRWILVASKTQEKIEIPIVYHAKEILEKYINSDHPIPRYSNQVVNRILKEIAEDLELNRLVSITKYHGGMLKMSNTPLYEVVTSHVGRKTFITNGLMLGIPERLVREISGHKDEKSFRRYVNYAEKYKSTIIKKAFSKESIQNFIEQAR